MSDPALLLLVQQLQQELQNQHSKIQSLRSDLNALRVNVHQLQLQFQLQLQTRPTPAPTTYAPRLPNPPRFNGKPFTLRTWLPLIRAKLRSDQLISANAFDYIWDRLKQPQQASVLHLRQSAKDVQSQDPKDIFSFFQRLCHNLRKQQEAIQRFSSIRQREEESLIAYLARFKRFVYKASASSQPDVLRVIALYYSFRPTLRQSLKELSNTLFSLLYKEYVKLVQGLNRRFCRLLVQNLLLQKPAQKPAATDKPIDVDQIRTTSFIPTPKPRNKLRAPPSFRSRPPSATLSRSRLQSSSAKCCLYYLRNGFCLYYSVYNYQIAQCPYSYINS